MPQIEARVATAVFSLGGAVIPMADSEGYREAMVGTLPFYDHAGERQHTICISAGPEYGKHALTECLACETARAKQHDPERLYLGIADRAASNWPFLERHTERQLIDFFHATEYVGNLAQARFPQLNAEDKRSRLQHSYCHRLKHVPTVLDILIAERARRSRLASLSQNMRDDAYSAWTYLHNHRHQLDYPGFPADDLPTGSGVTETTCKSLVKQRLRVSGMRWKTKGPKSCSACGR